MASGLAAAMAAAPALAEYQHHIQEIVSNGYTNNDIIIDLASQGLKVTKRTIKRRL
jgi:hypothetical protein